MIKDTPNCQADMTRPIRCRNEEQKVWSLVDFLKIRLHGMDYVYCELIVRMSDKSLGFPFRYEMITNMQKKWVSGYIYEHKFPLCWNKSKHSDVYGLDWWNTHSMNVNEVVTFSGPVEFFYGRINPYITILVLLNRRGCLLKSETTLYNNFKYVLTMAVLLIPSLYFIRKWYAGI